MSTEWAGEERDRAERAAWLGVLRTRRRVAAQKHGAAAPPAPFLPSPEWSGPAEERASATRYWHPLGPPPPSLLPGSVQGDLLAWDE